MVKHRHARELTTIDLINPGITEWVLQDLERSVRAGEGRAGVTGGAGAARRRAQAGPYDELSFHLADSPTYRSFCAIGGFDSAPSKATRQRNIKRITAETWQAINRILLGYAKAQRVENGRPSASMRPSPRRRSITQQLIPRAFGPPLAPIGHELRSQKCVSRWALV